MNERIKQLRSALHLTQQAFGERIGIKRNTVATYEMGRNEPTNAVISLICKTWNVNENWLRSGEGNMFVESDETDELHRMVDEMLNDTSAETKRRLISALLKLSPEQIKTATEWINLMFVPSDSSNEAEEFDDHEDGRKGKSP